MQSFYLALQFLTRIPVSVHFQASDKQLGYSVLFYPLVGLIIGALLVGTGVLLQDIDSSLQAAIVLSVWVYLSGGLHLDGLADCADAWVGGLGDREKTLDIMKDPAAGPVAVIVLVLLLLLKWAALQTLLNQQSYQALLLVPLLGRVAIILFMLTVPYVRKKGLAEKLIEQMPQSKMWLVSCGLLLGSAFIIGILPVLITILMVLAIRHGALARLGGMTGDVYGAGVELVETAVLISLVIYV